jgi:hypothetical protein
VVWDARRSRAVLFGGRQSGGQFDVTGETWVFDGSTWVLVDEGGASPPARQGHAMAWDAARGVVVLVGGSGALTSAGFGDTWELDGDTWVERIVTPTPSARVSHAMAWDDEAGHVVLFGGAAGYNDENAAVYNDTWAWDGTAWTELTPNTGSPSPRVNHTLVPDEERGVLILAGGRPTACQHSQDGTTCTDGPEDRRADVWEWDGATWVASPASLVTGIAEHAAVWDPALARQFLHSGWYGDEDLGGAVGEGHHYELVGERWLRRLEVGNHVRERFAATYDEANEQIVVHGGAISGGAATGYLTSVDHYDGETWIAASNLSPPVGRQDHAMVWVPGQGAVMLARPGSAESTWRWTGVSWRGLGGATHPQRTEEALAYDADRAQIVLFGGCLTDPCTDDEVAETWLHTGTDWVQQSPANAPSARRDTALAFDKARGVVVLFGGATGVMRHGDTWEWDGTDWADVTPAGGPSARSEHRLVWDDVGKRVLLFGGESDDGKHDDTWAWDGASWHEVHVPSAPTARKNFGFVWDPVVSRAVAIAGRDPFPLTAGDQWELEPGHEARAAVVARFVYDASGAPADLVPTGARVRAIAGGTSTSVDANGVASTSPGVSLRVWSGGRWREIAAATHAASAPDVVEATVTDIAQWIGSAGRPIHVAVTTPAPGGVTAADGTRPGVVVDYLELELTYTLP